MSSTCGSSGGGASHATGDVIVVRYADDFVVGFQHRHEAERFLTNFGNGWKSLAWPCTPRKRG